MLRRLSLTVFVIIFSAGLASAKLKEEDQAYLDERFKALQDQIQALKVKLDTLTAQLAEMRQNGAQLQAVIIRQQRRLEDIDQLLASAKINNEENFSSLRTALSKLSADQQKAFSALTGQGGQPATPAGGEAVAAPRTTPSLPVTPPGVQGYITDVKGDVLMVDVGSSRGVTSGAKLSLYKADNPNTAVGVLEVTQVIDAGNSRAKVVSVNPGVKVEFGDIVRVE